MKKTSLCWAAGCLVVLAMSCETTEEKEERLAHVYCSSCHLFPEPTLLDKETWRKSVLPQMAFRMGFSDFTIMADIPERDLPAVLSTIPQSPMISNEEWESIRNYYSRNAPDTVAFDPPAIIDSLTLFTPHSIELPGTPLVMMLKASNPTGLFCGTRSPKLYKLNNDLEPMDSFNISSPPSYVQEGDNGIDVLTMGIMDPNDQAKGQLVHITKEKEMNIRIDSLRRPVYAEWADLDGDGRDEIIVCEFGNYIGQLCIYDTEESSPKKHVLSSSPGARKTVVQDINNDGRKDILALFTQGDERLMLYTNNGRMNFDERILLRFPPVYGSSYFELADLNNDGFFDVVITNGDNADYSIIVKPYHAVTVFLNDGKNNFYENWSFKMPGASMAKARDFDQDGDVDIAAVSFFPDFVNHRERSFIYFENDGTGTLHPMTTDIAATGRWLVIEAADIDLDGDVDIILGATNFPGLGASRKVMESWNVHSSLLFLENKLK